MESCFISCGGLSTGDASSGDSEHSCSLSDMRRFDIAFGNKGAVGDWGCDRYYDTIATDTMMYSGSTRHGAATIVDRLKSSMEILV